MASWLSLPALLLAALLQVTFMPQIRILGGAPDLVFLLVIAWSIRANLDSGVVWAFVGGVLIDLLSSAPTGATSLALIPIVFAVNQVERQFYGIRFLVVISAVLLGTIFVHVVVGLVVAAAGFQTLSADNFTFVVLPTMAYNLVFIGPVYWLVRRIQRRVMRDDRVFS